MERRYDPESGPVRVITTTPTPGATILPVPASIVARSPIGKTPASRTSKHAAGRVAAADAADRLKAARRAQRRARRAGRS